MGFLVISFVSCDFLNNNPALLSFSYSSEISTIYGDDEDAKSTAPAWTSFPGDSIAYRIEGPPNTVLSGIVIDEKTGIVTVPKNSPAAVETWTVKASVGTWTYTTDLQITINPKDIPQININYGRNEIEANLSVNTIPTSPKISIEPTGEELFFRYSISPALPAGLEFDERTGTISGAISDPAAQSADYEITLTVSGNYQGTAQAAVKLKVGSKSSWVESLTYDAANAVIELKNGLVESDVTLSAPTLVAKSGLTPVPGTEAYSVTDGRVTIANDGTIVIPKDTDLSDIAGNTLNFYVAVNEISNIYAGHPAEISVNIRKVSGIIFDSVPTPVYGDTGINIGAAADVINGADNAVKFIRSSDVRIAAVDESGNLTILAAGEVTITAQSVYDPSVLDDQTISIAAKDISELSLVWDNTEIPAYAGIGGRGSISVKSGLIGTDTARDALSFSLADTLVSTMENGALSIADSVTTGDNDSKRTITVMGKGNYTGQTTVDVTIKVETGTSSGSFSYNPVTVEQVDGKVKNEVITNAADNLVPTAAPYTFALISSGIDGVSVNPSTGKISIAANAVLSGINGDSFEVVLSAKPDNMSIWAPVFTTLTVNIRKVTGIVFESAPMPAYGDTGVRVNAAVEAINGADTALRFVRSSDDSIATVDESGVLKIHAAGEVSITAQSSFDSSVEETQTLMIAPKDISTLNLVWEGTTLAVYENAGASGAISITSGLLNNDTADNSLIFNLMNDLVTVAEDGTVNVVSSVSIENDGFEYRVSVKGKNNYTGESTVVLTLDVQRDVKRPSGTFRYLPIVAEQSGGKVKALVRASIDTSELESGAGTFEYKANSPVNGITVDSASGIVSIPAQSDLSGINTNSFDITVTATPSNINYAPTDATLTVNIRKITGIAFTAAPALTYGDMDKSVSAAVDSVNGAATGVTFSSSNPGIAEVALNTGLLTIHAAGTITITATSTYDTTVTGDQVITIDKRNVSILGFGNLVVQAFDGVAINNHAISVTSGLINTDTIDTAVTFEFMPSGPVSVDAAGNATIADTVSVSDDNTEYEIKAKGIGNYAGEKSLLLRLSVSNKLNPGSFSYSAASVEQVDGLVKEAKTVSVDTNSLTRATSYTYSLDSSNIPAVSSSVRVDGNGTVSIAQAMLLSAITENFFKVFVKAAPANPIYAPFVAELSVQILRISGIAFSPAPTVIYGDTGKSVRAAATAVNGAASTVIYASLDDTVAAVDRVSGELTLLAAGQVSIRASSVFDSSVTETQTIDVGAKDIDTLGFSGLTIQTYDGVEKSGAISVRSGLVGSDTMDLAVLFEFTPSGPVSVDAGGNIMIANTAAVSDNNTTYSITVKGKGNYSGTKILALTLNVINKLNPGSFSYSAASVEQVNGLVKEAKTVSVDTNSLTSATSYTYSLDSSNIPAVSSSVRVDGNGTVSIAQAMLLSSITDNFFKVFVKALPANPVYAPFVAELTVQILKISDIAFSPAPTVIYGDTGKSVHAAATAVNGAASTVSYASLDDTIAAVDQVSGELTLLAAGQVSIRASSVFDSSVTETQTIDVAPKDIDTLGFSGLTIQTYDGVEKSGAISVTSGLIGSDTMDLAVLFEFTPSGPVSVDAGGNITIANTASISDNNTTYSITVKGKGNYSGTKTLTLTLNVINKLNPGSFSYSTASVEQVNGSVKEAKTVSVDTDSLTSATSYTYSLDSSNIPAVSSTVTVDGNGTVSIAQAMLLSGITENFFKVFVKATPANPIYAPFVAELTVNIARVTGIVFDPLPTLYQGDTGKSVRATATAVNGADGTVSYASLDDTIAAVDQVSGELTLLAAGQVSIRASSVFDSSVTETQELTISGPPDAPTGISLSAEDRAVTVSWSAATGTITKYRVYYATSHISVPGGSFEEQVNTNMTSLTIASLTPGSTYYFKVSAFNSVGESALSANTASIVPNSLPGAPTGVDAVPNGNQVDVSWNAPLDTGYINGDGSPGVITKYKIYYSTASITDISVVNSAEQSIPGTNSLVIDSLIDGTTYYFKVTAFNAVGEGLAANEVNSSPYDPPQAPGSLTAAFGLEEVRLQWTAPADNGGLAITGYTVYYGTSPGVTKASPNRVFNAVSPQKIMDLTNEQTYYFVVTAINAEGEGELSAEVSAIPSGYEVGDEGPAGGTIFYRKEDNSDGWRYLEAAPEDHGTRLIWGGKGTEVGGTLTGIGTGKSNTDAIVAVLGDGSYAAKICQDMVLNNYDDWFLPSQDELDVMHGLRSTIGDFITRLRYWSSSEGNASSSYIQYFDNSGYQRTSEKSNTWRVRPIRAF